MTQDNNENSQTKIKERWSQSGLKREDCMVFGEGFMYMEIRTEELMKNKILGKQGWTHRSWSNFHIICQHLFFKTSEHCCVWWQRWVTNELMLNVNSFQ